MGKVCLWGPQTFGTIIERRKERKEKRKEEKERGTERKKKKERRRRQGRRGERRQAILTKCTLEAAASLAPMENELTHSGRSALKGRSWEKSFLYCVVLKTILWPLLFMTWKLWRQGQTPLAPKGAHKQKLFTFVPLTSFHPPPPWLRTHPYRRPLVWQTEFSPFSGPVTAIAELTSGHLRSFAGKEALVITTRLRGGLVGI